MNILVDICHPAHVHLYKYFVSNMLELGHKVIITTRNILSVIDLLNAYKLKYILIGNKYDQFFIKGIKQIQYDINLLKIVIKEKIDICVGSSINIAHVSKITKAKSIILDDDDDDVEPLFVKYGHPFCDILLSPDVLKGKRKRKNSMYYPGYHELAYLHPKRFSPDPSVLEEAGLNEGDKYFILRFNAFNAHHDIGAQGLSYHNKKELIKLLSQQGKVFITAEDEISHDFKKYQIVLPPQKIHSFIYYATMFIGDSQTMSSEAAVLGTPSIRSNSFVGRISYLEEEEKKYGLTYGFIPSDNENIFNKIQELLMITDLKNEWRKRRDIMLSEKIDVTSFLVWFAINYPHSAKMICMDPHIHDSFR